MRFTPVTLALSLAFALAGSMGSAKDTAPVDPRAEVLLGAGRASLAKGEVDGAIDAFEAALAVEPGHVPTLIALGDAARKEGLQGKAVHYYRVALQSEPDNLAALAGEGGALAEKGATERARQDLARLEGLCGKGCAETQALAATIAKGPIAKVAAADPAKAPVADSSAAAN